MSANAVLFAGVFYGAAAVLVAGVAWRVLEYARTPAPLKIPTTPAPTTRSGVALRMAREVILFESLFKASLVTWALGWTFHAALAFALVHHMRYFTEPTPWWVALAHPYTLYAGLALLAALAGLWLRRIAVDRVRYISTPSDHLMLALLVAIAASGLAMKNLAHTDVVAVKSFFLGLMAFEVRELPSDPLLALHLALVAALAFVFPFSKLLHAPGIFFSPTRNQADDSREARLLAPWAAALEKETLSPALSQGSGSK
ncbi:MAG: respiratory nitrate reductase subunit gamma [Usitatibacter sp.]